MVYQEAASAARPGYLSLIPEGLTVEKETDFPELSSGLHMYTMIHACSNMHIHTCTNKQINVIKKI